MFTGLIQEKVNLMDKNPSGSGLEITVSRPNTFDLLKPGESIALDGVCLTLTKFNETQMTFFLGQETLLKTTWGGAEWSPVFNAERSLSFGERLGGHLVSGHVDETAEVVRAWDIEGCFELDVKIPQSEFVYNKGSIAINGVSLTVNSMKANVVSLFLIPETLLRTNLGSLKVGDKVNVEYDQLAKIVAAQVKNQLAHLEWRKNEHHP